MLTKTLFTAAFIVIEVTLIVDGQHHLEFQFSDVALKIPERLGRRSTRKGLFIVPHLYENDVIHINFCLKQRTIIKINNISYSQDGGADNIEVMRDGKLLGSFSTHGDSNWGNLWNVPRTSGFVAKTGMLSPGRHNLTIKVNSSDCYGVELWSMQVSVFTAVDPTEFWCHSNYTLAPKKWECMSEEERKSFRMTPRPETTTITPTTAIAINTSPPNGVDVAQHSHVSDCLDKKNVKIEFSTKNLAGTLIKLRQERQTVTTVNKNDTARFCETDIWQIGKIDNDNKELTPLYEGKEMIINITNIEHPEKRFPAKLLPFVTTDIFLHFAIPPYIEIGTGSAYLTLGLFNLTKPANIGLRYFDHSIHAFSDVHIVRFTPEYQVIGWNVPNLTNIAQNTIHLHFESEANVIMFDFLKLQYNKRDDKKHNIVIARRGHWKIRGLRYPHTPGMAVVVDNIKSATDIEDAVLLYQKTPFSRYETVARIHSSGMIYPYKTFPVSSTERLLIDVTGFTFVSFNANASTFTERNTIRSVHIHTADDAIVVNYSDGSVVRLLLTITSTTTTLQIVQFKSAIHQSKQALLFTSTNVHNQYAAVNKITASNIEKDVLGNLEQLSGQFKFTIKRVSPLKLLYANNFIEITFPE